MPLVTVTSPDTYSERKYASDLTVSDLKAKLEHVTGISFASQVLRIDGALVASDADDASLAELNVVDGSTVHVESKDGRVLGDLTDVSQVERFELSNEDYAKRTDTLLAFKQRNKLGRFDPSRQEALEAKHAGQRKLDPSVQVGSRCEVALSDEMTRRGTIKYAGTTSFGPQDGTIWIGVEFDEPVGKHDGLVDGKRYFQTMPMRASFVKPDRVKVGDFPEEDPFADDEDLQDT